MNRIFASAVCAIVLLVSTGRVMAQEAAPESDALVDDTPGSDEGEGVAEGEGVPSPDEGEALPPPPVGNDVVPPPMPTSAGPRLQLGYTDADVARLDAWLGSFDGTARVLRYVAAPLGILAGGALVGMGIWFVTDGGVTIGSREATLGLSAAIIAMGTMSVGIGIYNFAAETPAEETYARFTAARERGMDARTLGRFEGEFQSMAEMSRLARYVSIVAGFALALGGGIAMGVSAAEDRDEPRTIGLATGGGLAIAGVVIGALSFIQSPYERAWERYELGLAPDGSSSAVRVTPVVGRGLAGLGVQGRF